MDGRVIDVPWLLRRFIVGMILINRPKQSADAYEKIWTPEGSPLVVTSRHVQAELQKRVSRAGGTGDALSESVHPNRGAETARTRRGRSVADPAVPALRDVELRNRRGAGEGSRGQARAANAGSSAAAVLRRAGLHRGAGGQRGELSGGGLRPSAVQLPRHAGAAPAQVRSDRPPLPGHAELLRNPQPGARDVLSRAMFQDRGGVCEAGRRAGGKIFRVVPVPAGPRPVAEAVHRL